MSGGGESIGINKSTDLGIVITGLEVIEACFCGARGAKLGDSYMTDTPQSCMSYVENWAAFKGTFHSNTDYSYMSYAWLYLGELVASPIPWIMSGILTIS